MGLSDSFETAEIAPTTDPTIVLGSEVRPHMHEALGLLLQAYEYALDLEQDVWDLAVELPVLRAARLTNSDLRWLVGKGFVEHAVEITGPADRTRLFRHPSLLSFTESTCVVFTRRGVAAAREACALDCVRAPAKQQVSICRIGESDDSTVRPKWDCQRRQLRVGAEIVKEFKLPSPNQETVLMAFEEDGWPPRIDDPLRPSAELDPRRRLHDTIKALNRKQKQHLIRFLGDGSGEGIRWEITSGKEVAPPASISRD